MAGNYDALVSAMGERAEFDSSILLPDSFYGVQLSLGEIGVTDNGAPFVQLGGVVNVAAPEFVGTEKSMRYSLSTGKLKDGELTKKGTPKLSGGIVPLLNGATRAITGQPADLGALVAAGLVLPTATGNPKVDGPNAADAIARFMVALEPNARLELMVKYVRLPLWDGKKVIAHITQEPSQNDATKIYNRWGGFYALTNDEKGLAYVNGTAIPEQKAFLKSLGV